tara:strand:- start:441 stop:785 length:345 start_codon:yes stop_codon:yes gene_type:complete
MEESNRLIAEFMGFQNTKLGWYDFEEVLLNQEDNTFDFLKFHTSWDWLMPVVEKIKEIKIPKSKFDLNIDITGYTTFRIYSENYPIHILVCEITKGIETVHKVVVEFIKWYNKQ